MTLLFISPDTVCCNLFLLSGAFVYRNILAGFEPLKVVLELTKWGLASLFVFGSRLASEDKLSIISLILNYGI